ncbi:MAG: pantoate--beta-alanine ligase [Planctomycetota bacterium]
MTEVVRRGEAIRAAVDAARRAGRTVGLVPTMGALHEGHLSLVRAAREECDLVVASVFVNPTQFAEGEDYDRYPRDLEADRATLAAAGCDLLFAPSVEAMYPAGSETFVDVGVAATVFEGAARPTHFRGVATIVLKLLNVAPADRAYFGRKDYQQTVVVRQMVRDLMLPVAIRVCPLVRDQDGLALSSRNARLTPAERERALALSRGLRLAKDCFAAGERDAAVLRRVVADTLAAADLEPDYIALLREGTLEEVEHVAGATVITVAARVGETRLLDNTVVG